MLEPAKLSDLEAVDKLALQVHELHVGWQPQFYCHTGTLYDIARFQMALDSRSLYVTRLNGAVVGYVLIGTMELDHPGLVSSKTLRLEEICVAADHRHSGIGRQMMENVKSIAREMGCTDIRLTCAPHNAAAIGLYESLGMGVKCIQYCIQI